jgi:plasmid stabilization system protein ParE
MKFQVVVTARAKQNLRDAYSWAAERAPHTAALWLQRFERELQTLADSPDRFQLAHENAFVEPEIRQMIFGRRQGAYRVLFTVLGKRGASSSHSARGTRLGIAGRFESCVKLRAWGAAKSVNAPGIPPDFPNPESLITDDCIRPAT